MASDSALERVLPDLVALMLDSGHSFSHIIVDATASGVDVIAEKVDGKRFEFGVEKKS